jgi:dTDP-4-dehydrorhamnose reductase
MMPPPPNLKRRLPHPGADLELWGGVECTVNRVGDEYFDQLSRNGHPARLSDYDRFCSLGVKVLRQPILWERVAPRELGAADWSWTDVALERLQQLGIIPVAGLVHHGSGPRHTSLLDPDFPAKLAAYAAHVSRRYPWIEWYTPVNEPLTTARFSGLYGYWYPHGRDDLTFLRALLNQCRATVLAMREIRTINPGARLLQTEDLGKVFSTPELAYQADFENQRRWLSFDLLCGRVSKDHPMRSYMAWAGVQESELDWFLDNPCPPDVLGVNHYLSGERWLDHDLARYPAYTHGSNGRHRYADVLAARVRYDGAAGPGTLLMETWDRYRLPIAVTECHNGCTREEQLRWFLEVWRGAEQCRQQGAEIVAVTAWSLLGAFDWNHLVTRNTGHYESGVYDIRSCIPRPTAIAKLVRQLGSGEIPQHPVVEVPGWWKRPERLIYGFAVKDTGEVVPSGSEYGLHSSESTCENVRPVLITGGTGTLARAFARICQARAIPYRLLSRGDCDIADPSSVRKTLFQSHPWAVINAAGYVRVDEAEVHPERCYRENTEGPAVLAAECAARGIPLLTFSSDLVFPGTKSEPHIETDVVDPLNIYGFSKAMAEQRVLAIMPSALIVRSSAFFGPWDEYNFVSIALRSLAMKQKFRAAEDATVSPTYIPDLVNTCLDLLIDGECGIWHLANAGEISWAALAETAAEYAKVSSQTMERCQLRDLELPAPRPLYSALGSERAVLLPSLDDALRRFTAECEIRWETPPCDSRVAA